MSAVLGCSGTMHWYWCPPLHSIKRLTGIPCRTNISRSYYKDCLKFSQRALETDNKIQINFEIDIILCEVVGDRFK